jgi:hypothetical protein
MKQLFGLCKTLYTVPSGINGYTFLIDMRNCGMSLTAWEAQRERDQLTQDEAT